MDYNNLKLKITKIKNEIVVLNKKKEQDKDVVLFYNKKIAIKQKELDKLQRLFDEIFIIRFE